MAFAERLGVERKTVERWEEDGSVPRIGQFAALTEKEQLSLDYLVGRGVPPKWSDRAPIGSLAHELVRHVASALIPLFDSSFDGLVAAAVGGKTATVVDEATPREERSARDTRVQVTLRSIGQGARVVVSVEDPQAFLNWVIEAAAERVRSLDREAATQRETLVRNRIRELRDRVARLESAAEGETKQSQRLRRLLSRAQADLLRAALDPADARSLALIDHWDALLHNASHDPPTIADLDDASLEIRLRIGDPAWHSTTGDFRPLDRLTPEQKASGDWMEATRENLLLIAEPAARARALAALERHEQRVRRPSIPAAASRPARRAPPKDRQHPPDSASSPHGDGGGS